MVGPTQNDQIRSLKKALEHSERCVRMYACVLVSEIVSVCTYTRIYILCIYIYICNLRKRDASHKCQRHHHTYTPIYIHTPHTYIHTYIHACMHAYINRERMRTEMFLTSANEIIIHTHPHTYTSTYMHA
jgi:hypothetical protein